MSTLRQAQDIPFGYAPLGECSSTRTREAWRLLVPLSLSNELQLLKKTTEETDDALDADDDEPTVEVVGISTIAELPPPAVQQPDRQRSRGSPKQICIFSQEEREKACASLKELGDEQQKSLQPLLKAVDSNDGCRTLPDARLALKKLRASQVQFANLNEPIDKIMVDLLLASAMKPDCFRIRPILLVGEPGIGKTHFALQLAKALGVPMQKWSAGSAQANFQLVGSDSRWDQSRHGMIFDMLAKGTSAAPVIILDEVDKIGADARFPVIPALLDLLEVETARSFRDEYVRMHFDASRVIFILTANDLDSVSEPLLSRVEVCHVPAPEPAQRLQIIRSAIDGLRRKTRKRITLDQAAAETLAERTDIDLRQTHRLVVDAFAYALADGKQVAIPKVPVRTGRVSIGFVREAK